MTHEVLKIATIHYKECLGELRKTEAYRNMRKWEKIIIEEGGTLPTDSDMANPDTKARKSKIGITTSIAPPPKKTGGTGKIAKIREFSAIYIRKNGGHAHRADIQRFLATYNLQVTLKTLSVILSSAEEFKPVPGKGWSLK